MEKSWPFLLLLHYYLLSYSLATAATNLQTDEISLFALKSRITLNSSRLTLAKSWTNKTSVCSWTGVTCGRRHRRVVALDVSDMGLDGSIPPEIGNLSFLASLHMPGNSFRGDLPAEMGGLRRLRVVDLSGNDFSGEIPRSWFGNATLLEEIYLTDNSFRGWIPEEISHVQNLRTLYLGKNMLNGPIPPFIFNMSSLENIDLSKNNLSGRLPLDVCSDHPCSQFQELLLSSNNFSGALPTQIGNMTSLLSFKAQNNTLQGTPSLAAAAGSHSLRHSRSRSPSRLLPPPPQSLQLQLQRFNPSHFRVWDEAAEKAREDELEGVRSQLEASEKAREDMEHRQDLLKELYQEQQQEQRELRQMYAAQHQVLEQILRERNTSPDM